MDVSFGDGAGIALVYAEPGYSYAITYTAYGGNEVGK
jgi:hypothetical protein